MGALWVEWPSRRPLSRDKKKKLTKLEDKSRRRTEPASAPAKSEPGKYYPIAACTTCGTSRTRHSLLMPPSIRITPPPPPPPCLILGKTAQKHILCSSAAPRTVRECCDGIPPPPGFADLIMRILPRSPSRLSAGRRFRGNTSAFW